MSVTDESGGSKGSFYQIKVHAVASPIQGIKEKDTAMARSHSLASSSDVRIQFLMLLFKKTAKHKCSSVNICLHFHNKTKIQKSDK